MTRPNPHPLFEMTDNRRARCVLCGKVMRWRYRGAHGQMHVRKGEAIHWMTSGGIAKYELVAPAGATQPTERATVDTNTEVPATDAECDLVSALVELTQRELAGERVGNEWRDSAADAEARTAVVTALRPVVRAQVLAVLRDVMGGAK